MSLLAGLVPASLRRRSLTRNVVVNWSVAMTNAVTTLLLTPLIVRNLQQESYGVWSFLNGLTIYSSVLYLGLGTAFMRGLSEAVGRDDAAGQSRLASLAATIYSGLGLLCLALALAFAPLVPSLFAEPLPPDTQRATSITVGFLGARLALMFVNSALSALVTAHGRLDLVGLLTIGTTIPRALAVVYAVGRPSPMVPLAIVSVVDAALMLPSLWILCRIVAPGVRIRPSTPTWQELRSLYGFGLQAFVVQMGFLIISYTDTALIGIVLGAAAVGLYSLPLQLVEQSRMLVNGVTQNLVPELSAMRARGETARLSKMFTVASRACLTLSSFVNVHLVLLGPAFLSLWVGPTMAAESPRVLLCLALAASAAALSTQVMTPFYMAFDLARTLVAIVAAEALLNFALSYWFAQAIGLWGVALGTAIPAIGLTLLLAPRPLLKRFEISPLWFAGHVVGPPVLLVLASVAVQAVVSRWVGTASYAELALRVMASAALAVPLVLTTFERHELPGPLRRFSLRRGAPAA
jgi:O-antigen/teichoic acid export membrane protein